MINDYISKKYIYVKGMYFCKKYDLRVKVLSIEYIIFIWEDCSCLVFR